MADWTGHLDRPLGHCESSFRTLYCRYDLEPINTGVIEYVH
jgi:hypothetical protein